TIAMVALPQIGINIVGAILAVVFAFLFVTVSSRITGQIGSSANPVSGMTVATVLMTALIFLAVGWTGIEHRVLALSIGGVVCVAAAVAGATSQDLKTGYLVGATPARQQIGLVFGVTTSAILIGGIIHFLNEAKTTMVSRSYPGVAVGVIEPKAVKGPDGSSLRVGRLYEQTGDAPAGKYLVDASGAIKFLVDPGIGGREVVDYSGRRVEKLDSPKAQIMALVVDGILTQKLPWGLILIGAFIAIAIELLGIPSLPVAVGVYLPISTSATMFMGGLIRWLVERRMTAAQRGGPEADSGPGVLFSSGLIAGGAIMGVLLAALTTFKINEATTWADKLSFASAMGHFAENGLFAMVFYIALVAVPLYVIARRKHDSTH
ncbi:MAG: OPT/YSL family transporter, partial [Gemmatimonadaceae bacterium]